MASNTLAPTGLVWSRNLFGAPTVQANAFKIKAAYASAIGLGDVVATLTNPNQGYVGILGANPTAGLGVFAGVLPYYDKTFQQTAHGLNGSYLAAANPPGDIDCLVYSNVNDVFRVQVSGGPWAQSWRGRNINITASTNGVPNNAGISVLSVDATTIADTTTLPFRIVGLTGVSGGPQDPANTNPWIEVVFNPGFLESMQSAGI